MIIHLKTKAFRDTFNLDKLNQHLYLKDNQVVDIDILI